jgi:hypothetical protein
VHCYCTVLNIDISATPCFASNRPLETTTTTTTTAHPSALSLPASCFMSFCSGRKGLWSRQRRQYHWCQSSRRHGWVTIEESHVLLEEFIMFIFPFSSPIDTHLASRSRSLTQLSSCPLFDSTHTHRKWVQLWNH